jgi:hypothetical protein
MVWGIEHTSHFIPSFRGARKASEPGTSIEFHYSEIPGSMLRIAPE